MTFESGDMNRQTFDYNYETDLILQKLHTRNFANIIEKLKGFYEAWVLWAKGGSLRIPID